MKPKVRLAWISTHPIQYQAPLFKEISKSKYIDLTVIYSSNFSLKPYEDNEFQQKISWDTNLLEGYSYKFLSGNSKRVNKISFFNPIVYGLFLILVRGNFEFVMIQGWNHYTYVLAMLYSKILGIKICLRCEASIHIKPRRGLIGIFRKALLRGMFRHVDKFFAIGTSNKLFYLDMGVQVSKLESMPYSVDNHYFSNKASSVDIESFKKNLGIDFSTPIIMFASKFTKRKRPEFLLRAFLDCDFSRNKSPCMIFIGGGEQKEQLMAIAKQNKNCVKFFDFINQNDLPYYYAIADIFVLPSLDETWGLVINEVMNAGAAIIVSDQVGSGFDLVDHGKNGLIFSANDINELKSSIMYLLNESNYKKYGVISKQKINNWGFRQSIEGLERGLLANNL
jgi:glycosyltransferase involved in cell wall biosynthesis